MNDGSENDQRLLEKLSRQLAELNSSVGSDPNDISNLGTGNHWAQACGLSGNQTSSFSPLYSWDPSCLQTSPSISSPHSPQSNFDICDPASIPSSFPFPPPPINHERSCGNSNIRRLSPDPQFSHSPPNFQVGGDLSQRFSNIQQTPPLSTEEYNYIGNSPHYHQSNTPIVGRNFAQSQQNQELFSSLSTVFGNFPPPLSNQQTFSANSPTQRQSSVYGDTVSHPNYPLDFVNHNSYFESPPPFDPSTPPPPYSFQIHRQNSESSDHQAHRPSSNEFLDYLGLSGEPLINLGSTSDDVDNWQTVSKSEQLGSGSVSEEGKQFYTEALKKWNSFDFAGLDSGSVEDDATFVKTSGSELVPEEIVPDSTKPSYSEIARTPKSIITSSKVEQTGSDSISKSCVLNKDGKPYRPVIQRTISASKYWPKASADKGIDQPPVSPTSRYGLDSFEESIPFSKNSEFVNTSHTKRSESVNSVLDNLSSKMAEKNFVIEEENNIVKELSSKLIQKDKSQTGDNRAKSDSHTQSSSNGTTLLSKSNEKLFFDPKRIFQQKNTNKLKAQTSSLKANGKSNISDKNQSGETILNNGKPTSSFKIPSATRQHDYINNDLRDNNKDTNKNVAENTHPDVDDSKEESFFFKHSDSSKTSTGKRGGSSRINSGSHHRDKKKMMDDDTHDDVRDAQNSPGILPTGFDKEKLEKCLSLIQEKIIIWGSFLLVNLQSLLIYTFGLIVCLSFGAYQLIRYLIVKCWVLVNKIYGRFGKDTRDDSWKPRDNLRRKIGLEEKIALPSTGDEAMKRLLACKGKDPYSILGVRQDSSEEDIKKYYRKQAVLVHPDKNQEPGAEEAFKILGHAFEKIGEPSKRREYDNQALVESESELRKEFADLISRLQTKIQEAANMMPCDNCPKKHKRVPVDRPFYSARFCQRCNKRHPAKEGDVWAESTVLGFYWHYYALMDGQVFDITEWMKCHHEFYKKMRANEHTVLTRIATDSNKKSKHHHSRDANLEDFINRFFPKSTGAASPSGSGAQSPHGAEQAWSQQPGSATSATRKTGGRRKKKRH